MNGYCQVGRLTVIAVQIISQDAVAGGHLVAEFNGLCGQQQVVAFEGNGFCQENLLHGFGYTHDRCCQQFECLVPVSC